MDNRIKVSCDERTRWQTALDCGRSPMAAHATRRSRKTRPFLRVDFGVARIMRLTDYD